jgi:hypothetical protein
LDLLLKKGNLVLKDEALAVLVAFSGLVNGDGREGRGLGVASRPGGRGAALTVGLPNAGEGVILRGRGLKDC